MATIPVPNSVVAGEDTGGAPDPRSAMYVLLGFTLIGAPLNDDPSPDTCTHVLRSASCMLPGFALTHAPFTPRLLPGSGC